MLYCVSIYTDICEIKKHIQLYYYYVCTGIFTSLPYCQLHYIYIYIHSI